MRSTRFEVISRLTGTVLRATMFSVDPLLRIIIKRETLLYAIDVCFSKAIRGQTHTVMIGNGTCPGYDKIVVCIPVPHHQLSTWDKPEAVVFDVPLSELTDQDVLNILDPVSSTGLASAPA